MRRSIAAATVCQSNIFLTESQQSTALKRHKGSDVGEHHHVADHKQWPTPGIRFPPHDRNRGHALASQQKEDHQRDSRQRRPNRRSIRTPGISQCANQR